MTVSTATPIATMMGGGAGAPPVSEGIKSEKTPFVTGEEINSIMEEFKKNLNNEVFRRNCESAQALLIEKLKNPEFLPGLPVEIRADPFKILGSFLQSFIKWIDWSRDKGSCLGPGISDAFLKIVNDLEAGEPLSFSARDDVFAILMGVNNFFDFHPKICTDKTSPIIQMLAQMHNFVQEQSLNPYFSIKSLLLPEDGTERLPIDVRHVGVVVPAKVGLITEFDVGVRTYSSPVVVALFHVNGNITTRYIPEGTTQYIYIQNANGYFSHSGVKPKEDDLTYESEMSSTSTVSEGEGVSKSKESSPFESCLFCLTIPVQDHDSDRVRARGLSKGGSDTTCELSSKRRSFDLPRAVPGQLVEGRELSPTIYSDPQFPHSRIIRAPGQPVQLTCFNLICASNFEQAAAVPVIYHCLLQQLILAAHPNIARYVSPPVGTILERCVPPSDLAVMTEKFGLDTTTSSSGGAAGAGSAGKDSGASLGVISAPAVRVETSREALVDAFFEAIESNNIDTLNSYRGDIHYINRDGYTGLMVSIVSNLKVSFMWCLERKVGRQVDKKHRITGITALMLAAAEESAYYVEALIAAKASPFLKDHLGRTPLDHAVINSRPLPATYLLRLDYDIIQGYHYNGISQVPESYQRESLPIALVNMGQVQSKAPGFEPINPFTRSAKAFGWGSQERPRPRFVCASLKAKSWVKVPLADYYTDIIASTDHPNSINFKYPYLINSQGDNLFLVVVKTLNQACIEKFLSLAPCFKEYCNEQNDYGETVLHSLVLSTAEDTSVLHKAELSALNILNYLKRVCPKLDKNLKDYQKRSPAELAESHGLFTLAASINLEGPYVKPRRAPLFSFSLAPPPPAPTSTLAVTKSS